MKIISLLLLLPLCALAADPVTSGVVRSGWTTTTNPVTARAALGIVAGGGQTNWPLESITNSGFLPDWAQLPTNLFYLDSNPAGYVTAAVTNPLGSAAYSAATDFDPSGAAQAATNTYPWGSLYDAAGTATAATGALYSIVVPTNRTITIDGTAQALNADRSYTSAPQIANVLTPGAIITNGATFNVVLSNSSVSFTGTLYVGVGTIGASNRFQVDWTNGMALGVNNTNGNVTATSNMMVIGSFTNAGQNFSLAGGVIKSVSGNIICQNGLTTGGASASGNNVAVPSGSGMVWASRATLVNGNEDGVLEIRSFLGTGKPTLQLGQTNITPVNSRISNAAANGTDKVGSSMTITAGQGTGTGISGALIFQTAGSSNASGSAVTPATNVMGFSSWPNGGIATGTNSSKFDTNAPSLSLNTWYTNNAPSSRADYIFRISSSSGLTDPVNYEILVANQGTASGTWDYRVSYGEPANISGTFTNSWVVPIGPGARLTVTNYSAGLAIVTLLDSYRLGL